MHTYLLHVEIVKEENGRWSAGVPALPGCATWGYTKEEALKNIHDSVEAYIRAMRKAGEKTPKDATLEVIKEPAVAVAV